MKKTALKFHKLLLWVSLFAIVCWSLSGISHPMMAWFGPQAVKMRAPTLSIDAAQSQAIEGIIQTHAITNASIAKVVPTADGAMLQISDNAANRRYFSLANTQEINNYDEQQAKWLAAYYTGLNIDQVRSVTKIENFTHNYPRVNRLLPVYRVDIGDNNQSVSAFVYTETNVLASLNNSTKRNLQTLFQALHTWSWLDATGQGRVLIIALFIITLAAMASTGLLLVITIAKRNIRDGSRRWHRRLAYILWLPLLAWSASGFYHLLQSHYVQPVSGIRLSQANNLQNALTKTVSPQQWQANFSKQLVGKTLNAISLVNNGQQYYYRLSVAKTTTEKLSRKARFDGQVREKSVVYINSQTGLASAYSDQQQATFLLSKLSDKNTTDAKASLVTHFGPGYDFRNKRLPVWQFDLADAEKSRIFIDPITSILVDQNRAIDRYESLSFSILHKWSLLGLVIGRPARDVLIVITLLAILLLTGLGVQMHLKRRR